MASFLSAAAVPLAMVVLSRANRFEILTADYFTSLAIPIVSVGLAVMGSRLIYGLNLDVEEARKLGRYRLGTLLGKGAMGEVWAASHQMLARPAAIKLIRPRALAGGSSTPQALIARFEREAQATAQMRCPQGLKGTGLKGTE